MSRELVRKRLQQRSRLETGFDLNCVTELAVEIAECSAVSLSQLGMRSADSHSEIAMQLTSSPSRLG